MEEKLCSKYKHLLVLYSKDDLPYIDDNLEFVNYHHYVKWGIKISL